MNKIVLNGRLTRDVEMKEAGSTVIASFSIAVQRKFKNNEGEYETDFINCKAFGKTAEFINKYFGKGSQMLLEGRLQTGSYEKEDGTRGYISEVIVNEVEFVGNKKENQTESENSEVNVDDAFSEFGTEIEIDNNFLD